MLPGDRPLDCEQADFKVKQKDIRSVSALQAALCSCFPMLHIKSHHADTKHSWSVHGVCQKHTQSLYSEPLYTDTQISGQLEAALALANQRIAELEAQVKALQDAVQGLEEALAAAQAQTATLQVLLYLRCACNVHKSQHLALTIAQRICCSHSVTIMVAGRSMQAALNVL